MNVGLIRRGRWAGWVLLLTLAGCAAPRAIPPPPPTGDASWRLVVPPGTAGYQLALGEVSSGGAVFQRVAPIYPAAELGACLPPQEVEALLIVGAAGKVDEVRVSDEVSADGARQAFIGAVRTAARQWQFEPLQISRWAADADGNTQVVDSAAKSFSLAYVFRFECHAGRASVSTSAPPP